MSERSKRKWSRRMVSEIVSIKCQKKRKKDLLYPCYETSRNTLKRNRNKNGALRMVQSKRKITRKQTVRGGLLLWEVSIQLQNLIMYRIFSVSSTSRRYLSDECLSFSRKKEGSRHYLSSARAFEMHHVRASAFAKSVTT